VAGAEGQSHITLCVEMTPSCRWAMQMYVHDSSHSRVSADPPMALSSLSSLQASQAAGGRTAHKSSESAAVPATSGRASRAMARASASAGHTAAHQVRLAKLP